MSKPKRAAKTLQVPMILVLLHSPQWGFLQEVEYRESCFGLPLSLTWLLVGSNFFSRQFCLSSTAGVISNKSQNKGTVYKEVGLHHNQTSQWGCSLHQEEWEMWIRLGINSLLIDLFFKLLLFFFRIKWKMLEDGIHRKQWLWYANLDTSYVLDNHCH